MTQSQKEISKKEPFKISPKILLLFCIFIYFPTISISPTISRVIEYGIPLCYLAVNYKAFKKLSKKTAHLLLLSLAIISLSILTPIVHRTHDYSYIMTSTYIVRRIVVYAFLSLLIIKKYGAKAHINHFLYYFTLATSLYVIGTIVLVLLPGIKDLWFSIFSMSEQSRELLQSYGYTFRIGWIGFSGFRLTLRCAFCCIFLMYLYFSKEKNISKKQFYCSYPICLLGTMFYGRSGLAVAIIASIFLLFSLNKQQVKKIKEFAIIPLVMMLALFAIKDIPIIQQWYNWFTKPFINLVTKGSFDNYSFNNTKQMVYVPGVKTILLGDGYYMQDGHYYQKTDSGVMRNILFWGITGVILSYGATLYSIVDIKKTNKPLFYAILVAIIVFEYKGEIYYEVLPFATMAPLITDLASNLAKHNNLIKSKNRRKTS